MVKSRQLFRSAVLTISAALAMSACAPLPGTIEDDPEPTQVAEPAEEPAVEFVNGNLVQDLWLYEQIRTVNDDGEIVELIGDIVDALDAPAESVDLPHDAIFHVFDELAPQILDRSGNARGDVDVVAGLLEHEGNFGVAVLGTPTPDATEPIGPEDEVKFDVTFLGEKVHPEDPLPLDFSILQAIPAADEPAV